MNTLKKYLSINAIFSGVTGLLMLGMSDQLNAFFGITHPYIFPFIGINLIIFSAFVYYVSRKHLTNNLLVSIISGLDGLWVLGSMFILIFKPFGLSDKGNILIAIVGFWIAFLGYNQMKNNH